MPKISYPFSAVPNQVCRGGVGAINIAVLAVLLSHGTTTASLKTIAREVGCSRSSIATAIRFWIDNGRKYGVSIVSSERGGKTGVPTVYEVIITEMKEPDPMPNEDEPVQLMDTPCPTNGHPLSNIRTPGCPTNGHKEEPIKNNPKEDIAPPSATRPAKREKKDPNETVTLEQFVTECALSNRRDIQIIGKWAETTLPDNNTRGEWHAFTKRNLRAAGDLAPFSEEKLMNAFERLEQAVKEGWLTCYTLETLFKFATNTYVKQGIPAKC